MIHEKYVNIRDKANQSKAKQSKAHNITKQKEDHQNTNKVKHTLIP